MVRSAAAALVIMLHLCLSFQATSLRLPVISYNSCLPLVFKSKMLLKIIYLSTNQSLLATWYKETINMMCICMWKSRLPTNSYMHQQLLKPCIQSVGMRVENPQCGQLIFQHFQQFEEKTMAMPFHTLLL